MPRSPDKTPPPTPDLDAGLGLSRELRTVLYSPQKTELLCLIEDAPAMANQLAEKLTVPIKRNNVNGHLRELEAFGWIHVVDVKQNRGGFNRVWDLTDRSVSWRAFVAQTKASAPQPVAPEADATDQP